MAVDLSESRKTIDEIDAQIVELFERRMKVAEDVAAYKLETGKPIFDKEREASKIRTLGGMAENEFNKKCIGELFSQIMAMSRKLQYRKLESRSADSKLEPYEVVDTLPVEGRTVVYQGVPGAYSHEAMLGYFGEDVKNFRVDTFREAMEAVQRGTADYAVIPIDNSTAGMVSDTYDLLQEYHNYIVGETFVEIHHCLLGLPGTKLSDIRKVYSHQQALSQSAAYLSTHPEWERVPYLNTAMSAQLVAQSGDKTLAAVGSAKCAKEYGLEILADGINTEKGNTTRFVIVSRNRCFIKGAQKVSICFEIAHEAGSLYNIISHIKFNDLNMTNIESRPIADRNWEFRFFVDFEGNLSEPGVRNALRGISEESNVLKLLGNY